MADHPFANHLPPEQAPAPLPAEPTSTTPAIPPEHPLNLSATENKPNPFAKGQQTSKIRLVALGIVGLGVIGGLVWYLFLNSSKGEIILEDIDPTSVTIHLNDKAVPFKKTAEGLVIDAYPGSYRLILEKQDFSPYIQDILLTKKQTLAIRPAFTLLPKKEDQNTTSTVDFVRPSQDNTALFFLGNNTQTIYRMNISDRNPSGLNSVPLSGVYDIEWPTNPDVALVLSRSGTFLQEIPRFDFVNQIAKKVGGSEFTAGTWDPTDNNRIALVYANAKGEHSLVFTDRSFSKLDRKTDLGGLVNPKLVWSPDSSTIALIPRSSDPNQNNIWLYTTSNGNLRQLTQDGNVANASFSPDSAVLLYEQGGQLHTIRPDDTVIAYVNIAGHVNQAAWKDANSFFLPDSDKSSLALYTLNGDRTDLAFSFKDVGSVQGMLYFQSSKTLIFYTNRSIFSVNVGI
jgi:hypothetical protein